MRKLSKDNRKRLQVTAIFMTISLLLGMILIGLMVYEIPVLPSFLYAKK